MKIPAPFLILFLTLVGADFARAATVGTVAGSGVKGFSGDGGPARDAQLNNVFGLGRGPDGALYFCDTDNHRIRRILTNGVIETAVGNGVQGYAGNGGNPREAALNQPYEVGWDSEGNLHWVELGNHCVRRLNRKLDRVETVAGDGMPGFGGDGGPGPMARLNQPHSIAFGPGPKGDLFICDIRNHRIRRVENGTGIISTWSGTGEAKTSVDGSAIGGASLHGPRALVFDREGTAWLALREGNAVLRLDPGANSIRRVAGTGKSGFAGNGGPPLEATLSGPKGIALDSHGNVYLADTESHSIRRIDVARNVLERVVGDGVKGNGPDGDPAQCRLARPHGVFVDANGDVYIGDSENHRIRVWRP